MKDVFGGFTDLIFSQTQTVSDKETTLLEKGLKCNLHTKNWIVNLALEAEPAITQLSVLDSEYYRKQVAERTETLHTPNEPHSNHNRYSEIRTLKSTKTELKNNYA